MIIVRLKGGLGNQLFQYAFGRALSERTGQSLFFDDAYFEEAKEGTVRHYELNKFVTEVNCSIPFLIRNAINAKHRYIRSKFLKVLSMFTPVQFFNEVHFHYDEKLLSTCRNGINYYDGDWQSPRYFNAIRSILLEELRIRLSLSPLSSSLSESIQKENAISIHFRRGDYVFSKSANSFHGLCSLDYYQRAIELFIKEEKDVTFYVFSDDIEWVKANLKIKNRPVNYIKHTSDETNYEDLHLMSICKHHIIANSSFSWWGAWLNNYPLKRVIAPKKWFVDDSINTNDLIPIEWIRI